MARQSRKGAKNARKAAPRGGWKIGDMKGKRYQDPEPFTVAVSIAGIVSGLNGAVALYKQLAPVSLKASHRKAVAILEAARRNLGEIERSLEEIQELAHQAIESPRTPMSFGPRLVLVPVQFAEYVRHADTVHRRLGHVLKATHRLERLLSILPYANPADLRRVVELQLKIENLLQGRDPETRRTLIQIREIVDESRQVAEQLLMELRDGGSGLSA